MGLKRVNISNLCDVCCVFRTANACLRMVENDEKHWKNHEKNKIPNEQPAFRSHFIFLHEPYMRLLCAWWKMYFFHDFWVFSIVFIFEWSLCHWTKHSCQKLNEVPNILVSTIMDWLANFLSCNSMSKNTIPIVVDVFQESYQF